MREIAARFGVSPRVLDRHKQHLTSIEPVPQAEPFEVDMLLAQVRTLAGWSLGKMVALDKSGDIRTALACSKEVRECFALAFKIGVHIENRHKGTIEDSGLSPDEFTAAMAQMTDTELEAIARGGALPARFKGGAPPRCQIFVPQDSDD